jgi:transposase InsO family protein
MRRMGIEAIYRRPNTSKPAPGHRIYPYLLRGLMIDHPNHVAATDITYIPMARGFVYLAAVMDWFARRILAWRLSNTMEASFCIDESRKRLLSTAARKSSTPIRAAIGKAIRLNISKTLFVHLAVTNANRQVHATSRFDSFDFLSEGENERAR